jgi:Flp pilus assembly protein TadB
MLSDSERRRLAEIESALQADDPRFVRRLSASPRRLAPRRAVTMVTLIAAVVFTTVALVHGSVVATVIGLTIIGAVAGAWLSHRIGSRRTTRG